MDKKLFSSLSGKTIGFVLGAGLMLAPLAAKVAHAEDGKGCGAKSSCKSVTSAEKASCKAAADGTKECKANAEGKKECKAAADAKAGCKAAADGKTSCKAGAEHH